jgi:hypothetical protein
MKYIKLFEDFQDNLEDIKWALISAFDTSDFEIMTRTPLKDEFVVVKIQLDEDQKNDTTKERFISLVKGIDEDYNCFWTEVVYFPKNVADTVIVIVKGKASDVLYRNFGFRDMNGYLNYIKERVKKIENKWVNIKDLVESSGLYDFNLKMCLDDGVIDVELEEGSELQSIHDELFDIKDCFSGNSDKNGAGEVAEEVTELLFQYLINNKDLNLIRMYGKHTGEDLDFLNDITDEIEYEIT